MKYIFHIFLFIITLLWGNLFLSQKINSVFAQTTVTSCVVTKVGSPEGPSPTLPPECNISGGSRPTIRDKNGGVCPVPGTITCGPSKPQNTNYGGGCTSGHCAGNYGTPDYCISSPATAYAIDVSSPAGTEVKIPTLYLYETKQNHDLTCESRGPSGNDSGGTTQTICQYNCQDASTDQSTNKGRVWIQFHHSQPGSCAAMGAMLKTGDKAAYIWSGGDHSHIQVGVGGECGGGPNYTSCVPADKYLSCN